MSKPLSPHQLHEVLEISPSLRLRFYSEKKLLSYRAMLYSVNKQGRFRYRTQRHGRTALDIFRLS